MSDTKSAIEALNAEDTALLDQMRADDGADLPEQTDAGGDQDINAALADAGEVPEADATEQPEGEARKPPAKGTAAYRIQQLSAQLKVSKEETAAERQAKAVAEGVVAERLRLLTEAANAAMQPPPAAAAPAIELPDINTDPVGHFQAKLAQAEKQLQDQGAIITGITEQQQQARAMAEMQAWGRSQEAAFAAEEPSYIAATEFLRAGRDADLLALGITDPLERGRIMASDITNIAAKSRQDGVNFGKRIYDVAVARGFKKADAAPVIPAIDAALPDRAARIENGRANATTIAGVGSATPQPLSPERIANMSDDQFAVYIDKIGKGGKTALRDLLGH